ncbi:MAG: FCD domain-containing protein [Solirubrobacterales bacterium]
MRISRAEELSRRLEQEIVDNGLSAGERLGTKEDIRNRFGYAVATVNEALRLLEARGLIEARPGPGGGMFVASPSSRVRLNHLVLGFKVGDAPLTDCLAVRNALEPLVCREAAAHCKTADAKALRQIISRMQKQTENPKAFLRLNWDLHRRMARMATNAPLKTLYLTLLDFVDDGLDSVTGGEFFDAEENLVVHEELVEAVIDGNPKRLGKAIERHTPMADRWIGSDS